MVVNQFIKERVANLFIPYSLIKFNWGSFGCDFLREIKFKSSRADGLNLDKYGYCINPHVDQLNIFAAILIYFAEDDSHADCGTVFYRSLVNRTSIDVCYPPVSEFRVEKRIPFLPNTLVVFLQNPAGWHGVEALPDRYFIRKAYHATLSLDPEFAERVYGKNLCNAEDLYISDMRYLDPINFTGY